MALNLQEVKARLAALKNPNPVKLNSAHKKLLAWKARKFKAKWGIPEEGWINSDLVKNSPRIDDYDSDDADLPGNDFSYPETEKEAEINDWYTNVLGWDYIEERWDILKSAKWNKKGYWNFRYKKGAVKPDEPRDWDTWY